MFSKLFPSHRKQAAAPAGLRLYAIGDIHGRLDLLDELLAKMNADAQSATASRFVFLGDYVDRGGESRGVVERLLDLRAARPETIFLKGNHEAALLDFLSQPKKAEDWLYWGGAETLESYGVAHSTSRRVEDLSAEFAEKLPLTHLEFFRSLELFQILGDYLFVHAGLKPGIALEDQSEDDLLWIRDRFHETLPEARPAQVVVHGHHPVKKPLDSGWRIDVDTGAVWTGKLTAVVLEDKARRFLST